MAADYDNDGRIDIAINSIGGKLILLHNTGASGHWLEVSLAKFAPGAVVTAVLPDGQRGSSARSRPAAATSRRRIRGRTSASGTTIRLKELDVRWSGGKIDAAAERRRRPDPDREALAEPAVPRACYRPERICSRRAIVSSVTASRRMIPVTM